MEDKTLFFIPSIFFGAFCVANYKLFFVLEISVAINLLLCMLIFLGMIFSFTSMPYFLWHRDEKREIELENKRKERLKFFT